MVVKSKCGQSCSKQWGKLTLDSLFVLRSYQLLVDAVGMYVSVQRMMIKIFPLASSQVITDALLPHSMRSHQFGFYLELCSLMSRAFIFDLLLYTYSIHNLLNSLFGSNILFFYTRRSILKRFFSQKILLIVLRLDLEYRFSKKFGSHPLFTVQGGLNKLLKSSLKKMFLPEVILEVNGQFISFKKLL